MAMRKYFTMTDDEIPQNYYYDHLFCTRMMLDTLKVIWDGQEPVSRADRLPENCLPGRVFQDVSRRG